MEARLETKLTAMSVTARRKVTDDGIAAPEVEPRRCFGLVESGKHVDSLQTRRIHQQGNRLRNEQRFRYRKTGVCDCCTGRLVAQRL